MKRQNYCVDLFGGAGGLSKGLEAAGFECILGIDNDKAAVETFKRNHKSAKAILGDLRQISTKEIKKVINGKKVKLICGGPPCQGFSTVGTNDPRDKRNHLFLEFVRVVKALKPDYIVVENVTGLLSRSNESTLMAILRCFTDIGYNVDVGVLTALHYGIPEIRRRTIIIGNKFGIKNIYPEKLFKDSRDEPSKLPEPLTVKWAFDNLIYFKGKKAYNHDLNTAQINSKLERARIRNIPEGKGVRYQEDEKKYLPKNLWFNVNWDNISERRFRQTKLRRLSYNEPGYTINTAKTTYYHPVEDRYLTPREAAAIQSFPPDFEFYGTISQQWRQIGNAVPPLMAKAIGKAILEMDKKKHSMEKFTGVSKLSVIRSKAFDYNNNVSVEEKNPQTELQF